MLTRPIFTTLRVEGAILPPDLLQRVADGDRTLNGLKPEEYHLDKGEKLNEAINRAWSRLLGAWTTFRDAAGKLPEGEAGTTVTRERWLLPLFDELGYGRLQTTKAIEIEGQSYPISHGWGNVPIHLVGSGVDLDKRTPGVAGAARNSPHSLLQVLLNRSDAHMWGFVSNGRSLRVLRDNVRLTRQAYVEFDLQAMMEGQVYSDFVLLWLVCHESRVEASKPEECWLEKWSQAAEEQGVRALEELRKGVKGAIEALGRGFLAHPSNGVLREHLRARELSAQDYYRQLLRLVYRLIFLFVAEDRGLLLDPDADALARDRYTRFYSTARLRELAGKRRGTRHNDLYHALRLVMEKLGDDGGCPELTLTARGGDLFAPASIADLNACEIANGDLLEAVRALAVTKDRFARRTVDFKNLGSIELGSVYESLLELHPILNMEAAQVGASAGAFELRTVSGNERKTTGSFYTPDALIDVLLDSALDPVLEEACGKKGAEQTILALKVCDPAGGSGHIAIAAARRIAKRLAALRTGDEEPSPEALRAALREVITHCIYVVDLNPMAVELCKVNLWMEMQDPRKPLSFLDAHIKCGNSLIGVAAGMDISEIPDEAFNAVTGDDKKTASTLKKRNKQERAGQLALNVTVLETLDDLARWAADRARRVEQMPEDTPAQVHAKQAAYADYVTSDNYARKKLEYDLWTAAFFWHVQADEHSATILAPTQGELMKLRRGETLDSGLVRGAQALAERLRFFHWELEFPEVFAQGGFDAILSNPPWDNLQLDPREFFATSVPEISNSTNMAARDKLIAKLEIGNPTLYEEYQIAKHAIEGYQKFVHDSGRFPLSHGRINLMALFAELARPLINPTGRAGIIVPTSIATDSFNQFLFADLIKIRSLVSLFDFENREGLFPAVDSRMKFCLLTLSGKPVECGEFAFFCTNINQLRDTQRRFALSPEDLDLLNPNTRTTPVFRTCTDAELTKKIYSLVPVLENERMGQSPWGIKSLLMFMMNTDSKIFETEPGNNLLPLYEGKMVQSYDHRSASVVTRAANLKRPGQPVETTLEEHADTRFVPRPQYWVPKAEVDKRVLNNWDRPWLLTWKKVTSPTNERTLIVGLLPYAGVSDSMYVLIPKGSSADLGSCLYANFSVLPLDYVVRQKVGGVNLNLFHLQQFPILPPTAYRSTDIDFIAPRVLELVYTAWDLKPFAEDMGFNGEPFRWDEERRAHLRAELDAYYARLYGLTRDELRYILDPKEVYGEDFPGETFRVLKDKEMKLYGEYRTRRLVLEKWDELAYVGS